MKAIHKLGNPAFLVSVFLLVLNDWYLKNTFSNGVTGKLSDFAGLFAFPFFLAALFPKHKQKTYIITFLFFIVWKSPIVQPMIDRLNQMNFALYRTVDYTDYFALVILPVSLLAYNKSAVYTIKPVFLNLLIVFSALAFVATARVPGADRTYSNINNVYLFNFSKRELIERFNMLQLEYVKDFNSYGNSKLDFDSGTNTFYFQQKKDTIAIILDYEKVKDTDTIKLRTLFTQINLSGNSASSDLKLISITSYVPKSFKGDYKPKAIATFEKFVVNKIKNYK